LIEVIASRLKEIEERFSRGEGLTQYFEKRREVFEKNIELKISQAINGNMRRFIDMITLIVTVPKLADMFSK
jgi:hypothetical protein